MNVKLIRLIFLLYCVAFVRLEHPRDNEMSPPGRCYDTFASDVDVLIEITPEGKVDSALCSTLNNC
jgi:hypothetical protein